jgi:hypothetical protein
MRIDQIWSIYIVTLSKSYNKLKRYKIKTLKMSDIKIQKNAEYATEKVAEKVT